MRRMGRMLGQQLNCKTRKLLNCKLTSRKLQSLKNCLD
jgi:hypothetical protein